MTPQEWLKNASQNGLDQTSPSIHSLLLRLGTYDEETLWTLLVLLSACFSDLAKGGAISSLPPNMDLATIARTFTHLSSTMADAHNRLSGLGNNPLDSAGYPDSIPQEGL